MKQKTILQRAKYQDKKSFKETIQNAINTHLICAIGLHKA